MKIWPLNILWKKKIFRFFFFLIFEKKFENNILKANYHKISVKYLIPLSKKVNYYIFPLYWVCRLWEGKRFNMKFVRYWLAHLKWVALVDRNGILIKNSTSNNFQDLQRWDLLLRKLFFFFFSLSIYLFSIFFFFFLSIHLFLIFSYILH